MTGDVTVVLDESEPRRTTHALLHELAHARQPNQEPPSSIAEDWGHEADTWRQARQLASEWKLEEVFTEDELEKELATIEMFSERHQAASVLAGSDNPLLARAAYESLALLGVQQGWSQETLEAALWGYSDDDAVNVAAMTIDRSGLRGSWRVLGDEERCEPEGLDHQMNEASASLLRSALAALARERTTQPSKYVRHRFGDEQRDLGFLTLTSQYDLKHVLRHAMRALLAYPETSAFARWTVYRSSETSLRGEERVYRLKVDYSRARQHRPPSAELWVLVTTERERDLITETAWQGFIRSWLKTTSVRQESLKECWQELWGVLGYAGLPEE